MTVEVSELTVRFGEADVVTDVSFAIGAGDRFAIMGPSGAGKSTLLRAIAGLETPAGGAISIGGVAYTTTPTHERPIGLMFQDYALFPHLDVGDNVAFGLRMDGMSKPDRVERVHDLLKLVGLGGFESRNTNSLSGGEQQRVALARTLARRPALVMFDEPLGSLDQGLKDGLISQMRSIMDEVGAASIYVTHDRQEAEAYADRMAIMKHGRIVRVGTPSEIWSDPRTTFIARFIGHRNILEGSKIGLAPGLIVVPIRAIRQVEDGEHSVVVTSCSFRDGEYTVVAEIAGTPLTFMSEESIAAGTSIAVAIDVEIVRGLLDEVRS